MSNVTLGGNPITVSGTLPQTGDTAPNFTLTTQGLEDVTLDNWAGKRKVLNIVPFLPTCPSPPVDSVVPKAWKMSLPFPASETTASRRITVLPSRTAHLLA